MKKSELREMIRTIINEGTDWEKLIRPINVKYKTGSPYGIIFPKYALKTSAGRPPTTIYLPKDYSEFLNYLKKVDPKTQRELDQCETDFLNGKR